MRERAGSRDRDDGLATRPDRVFPLLFDDDDVFEPWALEDDDDVSFEGGALPRLLLVLAAGGAAGGVMLSGA